jgi:ABC-2 type transport system permease protein
VHWVSPVLVDAEKNANRTVTTLLKSSSDSWTTTDTNIQPNTTLYPDLGFPVEGEQKSVPLAVAVEGSFDSFFKDNPPQPTPETDPTTGETITPETATPVTGTIPSSPDSARLIVVGSSEFLNDTIFQIESNFNSDSYLNTMQFVQNTVDWATEDTDLLSIRSRGESTRVLDPLTDAEETRWEVLNYAAALIGLIVVGAVWQWRKRTEQPMPLVLPDAVNG